MFSCQLFWGMQVTDIYWFCNCMETLYKTINHSAMKNPIQKQNYSSTGTIQLRSNFRRRIREGGLEYSVLIPDAQSRPWILNFRPYTRMFWHVTWLTQAHVTNGFPPYSLDKKAVTVSKACDSHDNDPASVSRFL